jgi:hypothetical protein
MSGLSIKGGAEVESGGRRFIIMQLIGFDFVVVRDSETDDPVRLDVADLNPVSPAPSTVPSLPDLTKVDDRDWAEAPWCLDLIAPPAGWHALPARSHRRAGPKAPAWMPRRSTGGPGRTGHRGYSRRASPTASPRFFPVSLTLIEASVRALALTSTSRGT